MSNLSAAVVYFKSLAEQHVDIAHSEQNPKFFRTDIEEFYSSIPFKMPTSGCAMILFNYITDLAQIDQMQKNKQFMLCIVKHYQHNNFDSEEAALDLCEEVAMEIVKKISADNKTNVFLAQGFQRTSVRLAPMKFANASGKYVGWQVSFFINNRVTFCVNSEKWITPEP